MITGAGHAARARWHARDGRSVVARARSSSELQAAHTNDCVACCRRRPLAVVRCSFVAHAASTARLPLRRAVNVTGQLIVLF